MEKDSLPGFVMEPDQIGELIGKRLLVALTYRNMNNEIEAERQYHGRIVRITGAEGLIMCRDDNGEEMILPPLLDHYTPAEPGQYRLRSTGEIITDPDLVVTWTVYPPGYRP